MIDNELAAFIDGGVVIHLGTRNARLEPNGVRVVSVVVEADGTHVVVYVPLVSARRVLGDLEENGQAALVVVRPTDERAVQIKGVFAGVRDAHEDERDAIAAHWRRCQDNLQLIGLPPALTATWATWPCAAVRLRATALFNQTPGPGAGAPLA